MTVVLKILFAAVLTGATACAFGTILLRKLHLRFTGLEELLYRFILGSALLSTSVFVLSAAGLANIWAFAGLAAIVLGAAGWLGTWRLSEERLPAMPPLWRWIFIICFAAYGSLYFMNALAPEVSPDGSTYHLGVVSKYFRQHGFGWITTNMYANLSMGVEMLFLFAFAFGRHSGAATVHFLFYLALPLLMLTLARSRGWPKAGVVGACLVMLSPVVGTDGSSAYVDVAMAAVLFALFCFLQRWDENRNPALMIPIGLLAGFAYACKLTAFLAVPYAFLFVLWKLARARKPVMRSLSILTICAVSIIAPWLVKNAIVVGNPFSPFLNRFFPNPYVRISFEADYFAQHRSYDGIHSLAQIPVEATIRGGILQGLLGPAFLLLPLALVALRWPLGRQLLLAGGLFSLTYAGNIGTRFLIGALPFWSLALGMALSSWPGMALLVLFFHAVMSWPAAVQLYCDPYAWRIDKFYWKPAFRIEKEENYLAYHLGGYQSAKLAERFVPPDGKILTFGGIAEAYCRREVLVAYQAGFNNMLGDLIATGMLRDYQPLQSWTFRFKEQPLHGFRIVQSRTVPKGERWTVAEIHAYRGGVELSRSRDWRLTAAPNPWEVQLAFDNSPITRWSSWQTAASGMFLEVRFGASQPVSSVRADLTPLALNVRARLEGETEPGRWSLLAKAPEIGNLPPPAHARRVATDDLKRFGITHLMIADGDFCGSDVYRNLEAWGLDYLGEAAGNKLYKIK